MMPAYSQDAELSPDGKSLTVYFDDRGNLVTPGRGAEARARAIMRPIPFLC